MKRTLITLLALVAMTMGALAASNEKSGKLSDNISWSYDAGVLTFTGEGPMPDTQPSTMLDLPWMQEMWGRQVNKIVIGEGITSVGTHAFDVRGLNKLVKSELAAGLYRQEPATLNQRKTMDGGRPLEHVSSVELPSTLKKISHHAFARLPITRVVLPEGLEEIGNSAFVNTGLRIVVLPKSLKSLGTEAFSGCTNLQTVDFNNLALELPTGLFFDCEKLRNLVHPEKITGVGTGVFSGTPLQKYTPEQWMEIFKGAE